MQSVSFRGCRPPYKIQNIKITPIAKDPSLKEIDEAFAAIKPWNYVAQGCNGSVFHLGQDLVVKTYRNSQVADREISILDGMYDRDIEIPNIQRGIYAFANGDYTYLVSNKITGENPDIHTNEFNTENLSELVNMLYKMDVPKKYSDEEIENNPTLEKFPYYIPMHYDLHRGNINITENSAGILDFEFLQYEDLATEIEKQTEKKYYENWNFSDIPGILSNLRGFEYRALLPYLIDLKKEAPAKADNLFKDYLQLKSKYHFKMAETFLNETNNSTTSMHLSNKEIAHGKMLEKGSQEVFAAEQIKMQIADFIFTQSPQEGMECCKFNIEQIKKYVDDAANFFENMLINSSCDDEKIYWQDCIDLMKNWSKVKNWMDWQDNSPEFKENYINKYLLFQAKKSEEKQPVLIEVPEV